ncbi:nicotinamidase, partial [Pseudomonas syringae pv. tagetis]
SSHEQRLPFESFNLPFGSQTLRQYHCVPGSRGAQLHAELDLPHAELILRKGCNAHIDSFSAFLEADCTTSTGLAGYL